ncbi:MAG: hypothetical protein EOM87_10335 [Clostridia bacterium]|nr:hypothetical protein [Clostridia bacterium]
MQHIDFVTISERVDIIEVAERYGVPVIKNKSICPFHAEKTASLSYYRNKYNCFGCLAHGDAVDFVSRLLNLLPTEAAKRINADFGLGLNLNEPVSTAAVSDYLIRKRRLKAFREWELKLFIALCEERRRINDVIRGYRGNPEVEPPKEFTDALSKTSITDYYIHVLTVSSEDYKIEWLSENREGVESVAGRFFR